MHGGDEKCTQILVKKPEGKIITLGTFVQLNKIPAHTIYILYTD